MEYQMLTTTCLSHYLLNCVNVAFFAVKPDGVCNNGQTSASSVSQVGQNHAVMKVLQPNAMIETIEGQTESDCTHHAE